MGARQRLNSFYLLSSLIAAGVVGQIYQSWQAFFLIGAIGIGLMIYGSNIRFGPVRQIRRLRQYRRRR